MSLSPSYADATIIMAAICKEQGNIELLCNMSDYEQSYMTLETMTASDEARIEVLGADVKWSPQQRAHWASKRALDWSGLPVVHIKAAMFVENPITLWVPAMTVKETGKIRLPFELAGTAPVATVDVAEACAKILREGAVHAGMSYELTGPVRKNWHEFALDFFAALGRPVEYEPISLDEFGALLKTLIPMIPAHNYQHLMTLAAQNRGGRYVAEVSDHIELLLGRAPTGLFNVIQAESWRFEEGVSAA